MAALTGGPTGASQATSNATVAVNAMEPRMASVNMEDLRFSRFGDGVREIESAGGLDGALAAAR
jgi:hypothetical protein